MSLPLARREFGVAAIAKNDISKEDSSFVFTENDFVFQLRKVEDFRHLRSILSNDEGELDNEYSQVCLKTINNTNEKKRPI